MRYFGLIFMIFLVPCLAGAQDTLTLEQAVEMGLKNNYDILIEKKNQAIDENNVHLGNAGFLPTLDIDATQTNSVTNTKQDFLSGETINRNNATTNEFNARVELRWTLFDGLEMFTTYDQLEEIHEKGRQEYRQTVLASVTDLIQQYYEIAWQRQQLETLQEALKLSRSRKEVAKTNYNVGSGSKLDYMQARVDFNSDTSELINQRESVAAAKVRLNELMGRSVETDFHVKDTIPVRDRLPYQQLVENMIDRNPSLNISKQNRRISNLEKKKVKAKRYPDIGFQGGYDYFWSQSEAGFVAENRANGFDYGLFLTYPIFDGFNISRQKQNAKIAIDRSNLEYEQARQRLRGDLRVTYTNYANNFSQMKLERQNLQVAQESYQVARESYKLGNTSYLEMKEAQNNYLEARERLVNSRYETKQAEIKLLKLSGQLLEE